MAAFPDRYQTLEAGLPFSRRPAADVVAALRSDARSGLSVDEVVAHLDHHGRNELPAAPPTPPWRRSLAQFANVLTALLLFATAVSFIAWWIERESAIPYEALTILAIVILNGALGFVQERRAEQAVAALRAKSAPVARLLREGESGRRYGPEELPLAEELARRAAAVVENARLHEELERSERRFRVALADTHVSVFEKDRDLRFRWVYNPMFGLDPTKVIGKGDEAIVGPEAAPYVESRQRQVLRLASRSGRRSGCGPRARCATSSRTWSRCAARPARSSGSPAR